MTDDANVQEEMPPDVERPSGFLPYGVGGDFTGARRSRRAFRLFVLAVLGLTFACYFLETYWRREGLLETQYIRALTLEDDSQRAILRNVVARDKATPTPQSQRYLEALAAIEESDLILPRYEEAYPLNPKNQSLIINFGCQLFQDAQYRRARDSFREASLIQPPRNALPRYLEASALVAGDASEATLREAMALVARTNAAIDPLLFPQPPWHESLPTDGDWFLRKQRATVDLCCVPLYRFKSIVLDQARSAIDAAQFAEWDVWLRELEAMGHRLACGLGGDDANYTTSRTLAGLVFMRDALLVRKQLHLARDAAADASALREMTASGIEDRVAAALDKIHSFEQDRESAVMALQQWATAPLALAVRTVGILFLAWLLAATLSRVFAVDRDAWAVPHHRTGLSVVLGGASILFLHLFAISASRTIHAQHQEWMHFLPAAWYATLFAWMAFGVFYPFLALPRPGRIIGDPADGTNLAAARARYRDAALVLARRYFAILLGTFLIVLCTWGIAHRLVYARYPTEIKLLTAGMRPEELETLSRIRDSLR